jgi:hypothetical protein
MVEGHVAAAITLFPAADAHLMASFVALIPFARTCPPDLADENYWHLSSRLKKTVAYP